MATAQEQDLHGLVEMVLFRQRLDSMTLEVFYNLNDSVAL